MSGEQVRLSPRISVVICVYTERRWDDVMRAVGSVRTQSRPPHELVVVVDHNQPLLDKLTAELPAWSDGPPVAITANRHGRGLSGGRNTGVSAASGDVVAFLDDDAVADPRWLRHLADCYADERVVGAGGVTLPNWDSERPGWLPREFDWVLGCSYQGMPEPLQPVRNLFGGNASFRRDLFDQVGGFASEIGRSTGGLPLGCEETELCIKIGQLMPGSRLVVDDRAVIWHRVQDQRATPRYFITRCFAEGLSKAAVARRVGPADGLAAERRHAFVTLPVGVARNLAAAVRGDLAGLGRAWAILAGLAAAAAGYLIGRISGR